MRRRPSTLTPSGRIKRQTEHPSSPPAPTIFFCLLQIQEFSSGFWDGTKLACWMKGQTPWQFFPKLSLYLRATNTSQSFRITILPQVPGQTRAPPFRPSTSSLSRPHFLSAGFVCLLAALHPANHRRRRHPGLLPLRSVVVGERAGDRRHRHGGLLRGV